MTEATINLDREETATIFRELRDLKDETQRATRNKHDLAVVLISACILNGIDQRKRIVPALRKLGLKPAHVVSILDQECGLNPLTCKWKRSEDGSYILHPLVAD